MSVERQGRFLSFHLTDPKNLFQGLIVVIVNPATADLEDGNSTMPYSEPWDDELNN